MFIYKITNIENNKVYIGQSCRPIQDRFRRHINDAINGNLNTHFARAIRKYGPKSFVIELIDTASTQEELNMKEWSWIRYYNSDIIGYNETDNILRCGGNTYQGKTEEEMNIIKEKIRQSKLGRNNPHSTMIKAFSYKTFYELFFWTQEDCRLYFNETNHAFISRRVTHKIKSLYKGEWAFAYYNDDYFQTPEGGIRKTKNINVVNFNDFSEMHFDSVNKASKTLNIPKHLFKNNKFYYKNYGIIILED